MQKVRSQLINGTFTDEWKPKVKTYTAPEITGQKKIGGVMHYQLSNGNTQPVKLYDKLWKPDYGTSKGNSYKGTNPNKQAELMYSTKR